MSAILTIGQHHWHIGSAAVAAAIHEVLTQAHRLDPVSQQADRLTWRTAVGDAPSVQIHPVADLGTIGSTVVAVSPRAQAVLGEPAPSRRRTHQILNAASRRRALAQPEARYV